MSELALILLESHVFVPCMLRSNLLTLISNQINISEENLNEQLFFVRKEKPFEELFKDKIPFWGSQTHDR